MKPTIHACMHYVNVNLTLHTAESMHITFLTKYEYSRADEKIKNKKAKNMTHMKIYSSLV